MSGSTDEHSDLGNTQTKSPRSRGWVFTLNNYTKEEVETLTQKIRDSTIKHIVGDEVGESGTPHLQGWVYFKNGVTFKRVKELCERAHWERARGNEKQNRAYCSKEKVLSSEGIVNFKEKLKEKCLAKYRDTMWKDWQQHIIDTLNTEPDNRTINWVVDYNGNKGKSYLCKYLALTRNVIIADGKKDNVFNQINRMLTEEEKEFDTVILDIPRSGEGYINYGVLEQIKNGLVYSGKYEGGLCIFDNVHVLVFANFDPDLSQFSEDRWNITHLDEGLTLE